MPNEQTYTPGPWHHYRDKGSFSARHIVQPQARGVTKLQVTMTLLGASDANAALMALAPDMMALLVMAVDDRIDDAWLKAARAVIAKASGVAC